jgi:hypothetical protein
LGDSRDTRAKRVTVLISRWGMWDIEVSKVAALEEMYLIYQAVRNYLADSEPWGEFRLEDLVISYCSFCQREPIGGMFLEPVLEELLEQARGCSWHYTSRTATTAPITPYGCFGRTIQNLRIAPEVSFCLY